MAKIIGVLWSLCEFEIYSSIIYIIGYNYFYAHVCLIARSLSHDFAVPIIFYLSWWSEYDRAVQVHHIFDL